MNRAPAQLVSDLLDGSKGAYEAFYLEFRPVVYRYGLRLTGRHEEAEDLVQETFLRAFQRISQLRELDRVGQWLLTIAHNVWRGSNRRLSARAPSESMESQPQMAASDITYPSPEAQAIATEFALRTRTAINQLPEIYRLPVVLRAERGLSIRDIASALNVRETTVRTRLHRARDEMSQSLFGCGLPDLHARRRDGVTAPAGSPAMEQAA